MSELMPFRPDYNRIRKQMRARRTVRRTKRQAFSFLGRLGITSMPKLFLAGFVTVLFLGSLFLAFASIGLPNPARLVIYNAKDSTKVYDRNGVVLYDIFNEQRRTTIAFEEMPEVLKQATIAIEDKDFYHHKGFDLRGFIRGAVVKPLIGQRAQGGSTITQQFVKNALIGDSRTVLRKAKELILAFQMEQIYSKNKLLELYLNEIPYGNSAYGVEAASITYFNKHAKDLSLPEAAALAALPQAPSRYSPWGSRSDLWLARKDAVLSAMYKQGYITKEEMEDAKKAEIKVQPRKDSVKAPHFVLYVRELLAEKYGEKVLEEGGLKITTSIDWEKQKAAEEALASRAEFNKKNYNASNAALVSIDPNTGEILAMVGSVDYFSQEIDGNVNVAITEQQPGSSIKPIVYAAAFRKGYSPATMLVDVPTDFGNYTPRNYDGTFRGPMSIRQALANSVNIPAVKALAYAGVKETTDLAQQMGLSTLTDPERYGLSLTLGGGDVTLLDLTSAYGVFATGGMTVPPVAVLKVEDKRGRTLEEYEPVKPKRVLDAETAYLISDVLSDDSARALVFGTGGPLTIPGKTVAAKTGTTNEYMDGWTLGYTPDIVTGVWAGNNRNEPMTAASGLVAAPMWNAYMKRALADLPNKGFARPDSIRSVEVDALTGLLPNDDTPVKKTEVFASSSVPTKKETAHKKVRVVKSAPDKLAPKNFPDDQVEERVFTEIHSERPDNPAWENPVIEWAKANGMNNVPTETYDGQPGPSDIKITAPSNGGKVAGPFQLTAEVAGGVVVDKVEFIYDGVVKGNKTSGPFTFLIDPGTLDGKKHKAGVRLIKKNGQVVTTEIEVVAGG